MAQKKPVKSQNSSTYVDDLLKILGERIRLFMKEKGLTSEQVAFMVNLTPSTVDNIMAGNGSSLSTFILVCIGIGVKPMDLFNFPIELKPFNNLTTMPVKEYSKPEYSKIIMELIEEGWFLEDKTTRDVCDFFIENYNYDAKTKNLSHILKKFVKLNLLSSYKIGRISVFKKK